MSASAEVDRLYDLLPALYRISDDQQGLALQALLRLIDNQADNVRADIAQLWDDFFIETCQRWVVPYIGDLVSNIALHDLDGGEGAATAETLLTDLHGPDLAPPNPIRIRADVANTIRYRRRKGTPAMLEELARDVTGWDARVVEFFTLLTWTQHLEHLRLDSHATVGLRLIERCDRIGGPWENATHTVDVRAIGQSEGWYAIPNIGFFLWRLKARPHTKVHARQIGSGAWRFTFNPLGQDTPLFAGATPPIDTRRTEATVAAPIRPAAFGADLRLPAGSPSVYYGEGGGNRIVVYLDDAAIPASEVACANLEDWETLTQPELGKIRVDVALGRLILPKDRSGTVTVNYCDGFAGDLGGGQYGRRKWLSAAAPTATVTGGGAALQHAIDTVLADPDIASPVIQIDDNLTYELDDTITLAAGCHLTIQAGDQNNPHLSVTSGQLNIAGGPASLTLNGLLVEAGLQVNADLAALRVLHCTLVPGRSVRQAIGPDPNRPYGPSVVVAATDQADKPINTKLEVQIAFSIVGALRIPAHVTRLWLLDSIVDGLTAADTPKGTAISDGVRGGPPAHIERTTIFGTAQLFDLDLGSESLFTGHLAVRRRQAGCVRFSYVYKPPAVAANSCRWTVAGLNTNTTNLGNKPLDAI